MMLSSGATAAMNWRAHITERLNAAAPPAPRSDYDLNPTMRDEAPDELTEAAVLIPIVARTEGATVLLTLRTDHLRDHAGQVSFPGGHVEAHDGGPVETALRETEEEVGLSRVFVQVIGELDLYETRTGFRITPVVGIVDPGFDFTLDAFEVAEAFEVPLGFVLDPANYRCESRMWRGDRRYFYAMSYEERYIWGATAGMLVDLARRLGD
jgi:8-oxo-dGTP pyrophosphatase MutT (NUDIX family)